MKLKKRTKMRVHNPPCIDASVGDKVTVMECKPLSKTKKFVIIENKGKHFGFEQIEEAMKESKGYENKEELKEKEAASEWNPSAQE